MRKGAELMTELSLLLGLKKVHVTPYNSKANGKVEVVHKTTQTILRGFMEKFNKDWDILLPLVEFAMNTSVNKATGFTPFFLHFGRHPIMPLDAYHDSIGRPNITVKDYVKDLQEQRMQVFNYVNEKLAAISAARKKDYDAKNAKNFKYLLLGDTVRIRNGDRKGSYGKKFNPIYKRDYWTVINDLGGGTYEIQNMVDPTKTKTLDIQFLEKFKTKFEIDLHGPDQTILKMEVPHFFEDETDELEESENTSDDSVDDDMEEFEVAAIVGDKVQQGKKYFKVQWEGYTKKNAEWVPASDVNSPELIESYFAQKEKKKLAKAQKEAELKRKRAEEDAQATRRSKRLRR